jgi:hypothetical protein
MQKENSKKKITTEKYDSKDLLEIFHSKYAWWRLRDSL